MSHRRSIYVIAFGCLVWSLASAFSVSKKIITFEAHFPPASAELEESTYAGLQSAMTTLKEAGLCPVEIFILSSVPRFEESRLPNAVAIQAARELRVARFFEGVGVPGQVIYADQPGRVPSVYAQVKSKKSGYVLIEVVGLPPAPRCSASTGRSGLHFYPHVKGA